MERLESHLSTEIRQLKKPMEEEARWECRGEQVTEQKTDCEDGQTEHQLRP